ncbi:MAG: thiolase family protein [Actinomycetota bacterium]
MMQQEKILVVDGARTAVGSYGGALAGLPAHELGARAAAAAMSRSGIEPDSVDEVIMGCIGQVGPDAYNARRVALTAGLPARTPAYTVNRLCGSGLQAIWSGAMQLAWGGAETVLAGGNESMSRMPFYDFAARSGNRLGDRTMTDGTVAMLTDPFLNAHMGITAERVATKYGVSRREQDEFALESQRRAASAVAREVFAEEIVPVTTPGKNSQEITRDEHPRPQTRPEDLERLKPVFEAGGTVTAGNSSGINDGAAAVVLMREDTLRRRELTALASLEYVARAGIEPELMGYAPTLALRELFRETGLSPADIGIVELNEAFAAQAVAVIRDAGLDRERTNPYGGAIALGHPVGATGAILSLRVAKELQRRQLEYGIVTMCIGGGQALAALFRRYEA